MTRSNYEEKRQERIVRFRELSDKNADLSTNLLNTAHKMAEIIPLGQPILVGHHSEKQDRNYRDRIHRTFEKGIEAQEKSEHYARRAASAEENRAISSDDPEAVARLKAKLADAERLQTAMRDANKIIKSKKYGDAEKVQKLLEYGTANGVKTLQSEALIKDLLLPDFCNRIGFPDYALTNNSAEIRRIKKRIEALEREAGQETTETRIGDIVITDSLEENRILISFPGIPDESVRDRLKADGFRWSPTNRAWQAFRTAAWKIPYIVKMLTVMPPYISPAMVPSEEIVQKVTAIRENPDRFFVMG